MSISDYRKSLGSPNLLHTEKLKTEVGDQQYGPKEKTLTLHTYFTTDKSVAAIIVVAGETCIQNQSQFNIKNTDVIYQFSVFSCAN